METLLAVHALARHPDTPADAVTAVSCSISWRHAGAWCFDFMVDAPLDALRLPPPAEPARRDGLWQSTCFELFLRAEGGESYFEFNFSPSGEWAAYRFDNYRSGRTELAVAAPRILSTDPRQFDLSMAAHLTGLGMDAETVRTLLAARPPADRPAPSRLALSACLDDPGLAAGGPWQAGLSAVIEETGGARSYWALAHPPGEPDFHHPDCFVLELSPASSHAIRYRPPPRRP